MLRGYKDPKEGYLYYFGIPYKYTWKKIQTQTNLIIRQNKVMDNNLGQIQYHIYFIETQKYSFSVFDTEQN